MGSILGLISPYLCRLVVDEAIEKHDVRIFTFLALALGAIVFLSSLIDLFREYLEHYVNQKITLDLQKKVFKNIQGYSYQWFQKKSAGQHLYNLSYDIKRVTQFITEIPPQLLFLFIRLLLTLIIMYFLDFKMACIAIVLIPFIYVPYCYFSSIVQRSWKVLNDSSQSIFVNLEELFSHIYLIKLFGKESVTIRTYFKKVLTNTRLSIRHLRLESLRSVTSVLAGKAVAGFIVVFGIYQVITGRMSLGTFSAIIIYFGQLMVFQTKISESFQVIIRGITSCQVIEEIMGEQLQIVTVTDKEKISIRQGSILFQEVNFGYKREGHIFKNINFCIEASKHIALVGPSGCGKTTFVNLLMRLYEPWSGKILIDGYDINNMSLSVLKSQIGVACQEPFLWNDSIANNIVYGKEDATMDEIIRVSQIVGIEEIINNFSNRYNTIIGENGCMLSDGQKQRIAIARALIKRPTILILDEAMSSLDASSEDKIVSNIKQFQDKITFITISHRLSTVMCAELVYCFINSHEIITCNSKDLLNRESEFSKLFAHQIINSIPPFI